MLFVNRNNMQITGTIHPRMNFIAGLEHFIFKYLEKCSVMVYVLLPWVNGLSFN